MPTYFKRVAKTFQWVNFSFKVDILHIFFQHWGGQDSLITLWVIPVDNQKIMKAKTISISINCIFKQ